MECVIEKAWRPLTYRIRNISNGVEKSGEFHSKIDHSVDVGAHDDAAFFMLNKC